MPRMTPEKKTLLRTITAGHQAGAEWFTKAALVKFPGSMGSGGISRTLKALASAGYVEEKEVGNLAWYRATPDGVAYCEHSSQGRRGNGSKPAMSEEEIGRARQLLAERDGKGRAVYKRDTVARMLGVSESTLRLSLNPRLRELLAKRRRDSRKKEKRTT